MSPEVNSKNKVKSLEKALLILELMIDRGRSLGIQEICQELGYTKGTVHRILGTLRERKFVQQNPVTKLYGLGYRSLSIGSLGRKEDFLKKIMDPFLRTLQMQCGETVSAAVSDYNRIRYIIRLDSSEILRISVAAGTQFPFHCSATGKIFLSYLSDDEIRRLYSKEKGLEKLTENTIDNVSDLIKILCNVRETRIAIDDEEALNGVYCVAAPIVGENGKCVASISISIPKNRASNEKSMRSRKMVSETARKISESLLIS